MTTVPMPTQPLISVIMPVCNGEKYLVEAVESISRQGYHPLELIIVDDGSTDRTAEIAHSFDFDVRYMRQPNSGPATARNKGLELARGEVIAFQDADDLWPANKLRIQLSRFANDPRLEIVMGHVQQIKQTKSLAGTLTFEDHLVPYASYHLGIGLYRKSVFGEVGIFDVTMRYSEDLDWFMRARERNVPMVILDQVTLLYRLHEQNMTRGKDLQELSYLRALKKSLDRRRQNNQTALSLPDLRRGGETSWQARSDRLEKNGTTAALLQQGETRE